jgi:hypothetical protein
MAAAPWVQYRKLSRLPQMFPPDPGSPADLVPNHGPDYSDSYLEELREARLMVDNYRGMLVEESDLPDRLEHQTLIALGGTFAEDETSGASFLADVHEQVRTRFDLIAADTSRVVTLTSREGIIPVLVTNDGDDHVRVIVELDSLRLQPTAETQQVVLAPHSTQNRVFRVTSLTTGRFPVRVRILTPNNFELHRERLVVRSTAYNVLALVITFGAAFFLLLWWGRRFLPRRRP